MPKRPLKKTKAKMSPTKKAKKPAPRKPAGKKAAAAPPKSFMWKLLEKKQLELKRGGGPARHPFSHVEHQAAPVAPEGHTRFHGPRRKAA